MIPALVLAVLGGQAVRVLAFPLAFLFFAVPFGRGIVPVLMQFTADLATFGLRITGVPVLRSYMYISIPAGNFEVARACSGLNYFVTALVLGVLYAWLTYRSWTKRILCVAAFVVIPVLLNGLRVYFTILVSHWTDMRFGPGTEHVTFGRIFFVAMMLVIFWVGRRWADDDPAPQPLPTTAPPASRTGFAAWLPVAAALAALWIGPLGLQSSVTASRAAIGDGSDLVSFVRAAPGWQIERVDEARWAPDYAGGLARRQVMYRQPGSDPVDVFVAVYGLGQTLGDEMIHFGNVIDDSEHGSLLSDRKLEVSLGRGRSLPVREVSIHGEHGSLLVWQWFMVGERPVVSPFATKALEAVAFVTRNAATERIVTLATPDGPEARARLQAFAEAHGECIEAGFAGEACRG
jgi:EpsI family protein